MSVVRYLACRNHWVVRTLRSVATHATRRPSRPQAKKKIARLPRKPISATGRRPASSFRPSRAKDPAVIQYVRGGFSR